MVKTKDLAGLLHRLERPTGPVDVVLDTDTYNEVDDQFALSYLLASIPAIGVVGLWWSIPIGWLLADLAGLLYYKKFKKQLLEQL